MASKRSIITISRTAISFLKTTVKKSPSNPAASSLFGARLRYNVTASTFRLSGLPYNWDVRVPSLVATARMTTSTEKVCKWSRPMPMTLTYYTFPTEDTVKNLSPEEIRSAFKHAFAHWSEVIPVYFAEVGNPSEADIKIGFYRNDVYPFDRKEGNVLAYAHYPEDGNMYLNADIIWAVDFKKEKSSNAYDLESVAVHEIGHVLGLTGHSEDRESVMYPTSYRRKRNVNITVEDAKRVQELYDVNLHEKLHLRRWLLKIKTWFSCTSKKNISY